MSGGLLQRSLHGAFVDQEMFLPIWTCYPRQQQTSSHTERDKSRVIAMQH